MISVSESCAGFVHRNWRVVKDWICLGKKVFRWVKSLRLAKSSPSFGFAVRSRLIFQVTLIGFKFVRFYLHSYLLDPFTNNYLLHSCYGSHWLTSFGCAFNYFLLGLLDYIWLISQIFKVYVLIAWPRFTKFVLLRWLPCLDYLKHIIIFFEIFFDDQLLPH